MLPLSALLPPSASHTPDRHAPGAPGACAAAAELGRTAARLASQRGAAAAASAMSMFGPRMLVAPVVVYMIKQNLDLDDPETVNYIRIVYGTCQAVVVLILLYITSVPRSARWPRSTLPFLSPAARDADTRCVALPHCRPAASRCS